MIRSPALALLLALAATTADAGWRTPDGVMLEDTPSQQSERGFGAMLQVATEAESKRFHEEWYGTATDHSPKLQTTDSARRGDTVSVLVLYAGCALDDAAQDTIAANKAPCGAQLRLRVVAPDGSDYGNPEEMSLAQSQPSAPGHILQLSPVELKIRFEPGDALGDYRIEARIDHPDKDSLLQLSTTLTLKPADAE
ncbi:MAG: hypothetical protein HOP03_14550 [Lysobacter sp.]|nr:hypothetical protein [Lysobacter sp.]